LEETYRIGLKFVVSRWAEKGGSDYSYAQIEKLIDFGVDGIITDQPNI
jgi:hypothetical protein